MIVCHKLGLRYVGIELNPQYIDLSLPRLDQPLVFTHERPQRKPRPDKPPRPATRQQHLFP